MSQTHEQSNILNDHEDPDGLATWAIGLGGAFLMITAVAVACGIYYSSTSTEVFKKSVNVRYEERDLVIAQQQAMLDGPAHWVEDQDPVTGNTTKRLVIPIDDAIGILTGNLK